MVTEDKERFELIKMLDLPEGAGLDERTRRWAGAFEAWLEERRRAVNRSTGSDSYRAWGEFLALSGKVPWEVDGEDVGAYIRHLEERRLRPTTIGHRLAGLGSFYAYCQEHGVDPECGPSFNPVKGAQRPRVVNYEKARCLSEKEENALLEAIRGDDSPISKRDYALFLTLLRTGWKLGKAREMKWGDFRQGEGERRCAYG